MLPKPERFVAPQFQSAPNELANEAKSRALPAAKRYTRMGSASLGGRARLTRAKAAGAAPVDAGRLGLINSLASFPTEPHMLSRARRARVEARRAPAIRRPVPGVAAREGPLPPEP